MADFSTLLTNPAKYGATDPKRYQKTTPPVVPPPNMHPAPMPGPGGNITPPQPGQMPPQAGGSDLGSLYNFFKTDLQAQTDERLQGAQVDAAKRGVFYGTPLTGSEADINTQFLRGLGQLQSGMYLNQQQDQLARLGLATNLIGPFAQQNMPKGADQDLMVLLGQLMGQSNAASGQRGGPAPVIDNVQRGNKTQSQGGSKYPVNF